MCSHLPNFLSPTPHTRTHARRHAETHRSGHFCTAHTRSYQLARVPSIDNRPHSLGHMCAEVAVLLLAPRGSQSTMRTHSFQCLRARVCVCARAPKDAHHAQTYAPTHPSTPIRTRGDGQMCGDDVLVNSVVLGSLKHAGMCALGH